MNWRADSADGVARQLLDEFIPFSHAVQVRMGTTVLVRGSEFSRRRVTVVSPRHEELEFDAVVLAVGFGLETTVAPQPLRSYWRDDSLHQPECEARTGGRTQYLVSGNGDGGLVDLLRLRLCDFRHEALLADVSASADLRELASELSKIENEARSEVVGHRSPDRALYDGYRNLHRTVPALTDHLTKRLREDTHVVFNYPNWPLSLRSSILHRLLVSRLLAIDTALEPLPGRLISVDGHEPTLQCVIDTDSGRIQRSFHRVVIRHGPRSALGDAYPSLHSRFEPDLRARNALDATRSRAWPDGFFGRPSSSEPADGAQTGRAPAPSGVAESNGTAPPIASAAAANASPKTVRPEARRLRDALLAGDVDGLEAKFELLSKGETRFILRSIADRALEDDGAVRAFGRLVAGDAIKQLESELVCGAVTDLVRRAAFAESIPRKIRMLELPANALKEADGPVLTAFFEDIFDIVDRDQFDEVNAIVSAMVLAEGAIPPDRYVRYFHTLVGQARSSSYHGAPAAHRALKTLPDEIADVAMRELNPELLARHSNVPALRSFIERHRKRVPLDKEGLVEDFLGLSHLEFCEKYEGPRPPPSSDDDDLPF